MKDAKAMNKLYNGNINDDTLMQFYSQLMEIRRFCDSRVAFYIWQLMTMNWLLECQIGSQVWPNIKNVSTLACKAKIREIISESTHSNMSAACGAKKMSWVFNKQIKIWLFLIDFHWLALFRFRDWGLFTPTPVF